MPNQWNIALEGLAQGLGSLAQGLIQKKLRKSAEDLYGEGIKLFEPTTEKKTIPQISGIDTTGTIPTPIMETQTTDVKKPVNVQTPEFMTRLYATYRNLANNPYGKEYIPLLEKMYQANIPTHQTVSNRNIIYDISQVPATGEYNIKELYKFQPEQKEHKWTDVGIYKYVEDNGQYFQRVTYIDPITLETTTKDIEIDKATYNDAINPQKRKIGGIGGINIPQTPEEQDEYSLLKNYGELKDKLSKDPTNQDLIKKYKEAGTLLAQDPRFQGKNIEKASLDLYRTGQTGTSKRARQFNKNLIERGLTAGNVPQNFNAIMTEVNKVFDDLWNLSNKNYNFKTGLSYTGNWQDEATALRNGIQGLINWYNNEVSPSSLDYDTKNAIYLYLQSEINKLYSSKGLKEQ